MTLLLTGLDEEVFAECLNEIRELIATGLQQAIDDTYDTPIDGMATVMTVAVGRAFTRYLDKHALVDDPKPYSGQPPFTI